MSSAARAVRSGGACSANSSSQHRLADRQHEVDLSRHARGLLELGFAAERDHASGLHLGAQRRQLRDAEHRRERRDDQPAVQAPEQRDDRGDGVPADQDHGVARLGAQGGQSARQGDCGAAQLVVGDLALGEDERHLVGRLVGPRGELLPEVTLAPVAICVVAVRFRLEAECGHRPSLSSRPYLPSSGQVPDMMSVHDRFGSAMRFRAQAAGGGP